MIVRTRKNRNYTTINNTVLEDDRLSWRAKGIAAYLLSKPDDWQINHEHLLQHGTEGRDAVLSAMKELESCGYLVRTKTQGSDGKFSTVVTLLEVPQPSPENPESVNENRVLENRVLENRQSVNQDSLVSTDYQVLITNTDTTYLPAVQGATPTPQQEMFGAICEALGWDYKTLAEKDRVRVAQACGILRKANYTVDDIRRFMVEIWFHDWRWEKKQQHPTLENLRQEIGKLRSLVPSAAPAPQTGLDLFKAYARKNGIEI